MNDPILVPAERTSSDAAPPPEEIVSFLARPPVSSPNEPEQGVLPHRFVAHRDDATLSAETVSFAALRGTTFAQLIDTADPRSRMPEALALQRQGAFRATEAEVPKFGSGARPV